MISSWFKQCCKSDSTINYILVSIRHTFTLFSDSCSSRLAIGGGLKKKNQTQLTRLHLAYVLSQSHDCDVITLRNDFFYLRI